METNMNGDTTHGGAGVLITGDGYGKLIGPMVSLTGDGMAGPGTGI